MIRRLKAKQRGIKCEWCESKATQRGYGHCVACGDHLEQLREKDARARRPDYSDAQFYAGY